MQDGLRSVIADQFDFIESESDVTIDSVTDSSTTRMRALLASEATVTYSALVFSTTTSDLTTLLDTVSSEMTSAFSTTIDDDVNASSNASSCDFALALSALLGSSSSVSLDCSASESYASSSITIIYAPTPTPTPAPTVLPGSSGSGSTVDVATSALIACGAAVIVVIGVFGVMRHRKGKSLDDGEMHMDVALDDLMRSSEVINGDGSLRSMESGDSFQYFDFQSQQPREEQEGQFVGRQNNNSQDVEFEAWLCDSGLESFLNELGDMGVHSIDDIRSQKLVDKPDALIAIGFRKIQIAKLRRALALDEQKNAPVSKDSVKLIESIQESSSLPAPPSLRNLLTNSETPHDALTGRSLLGVLTDAGVERYLDEFSNIGVLTVHDLDQALTNTPDIFAPLGLRKVQLARLRQALLRSVDKQAEEEPTSASPKEPKQSIAKGIKL